LTDALLSAIKGVIPITAFKTHACALRQLLCDRPRRRRRRSLDDLSIFTARQNQES